MMIHEQLPLQKLHPMFVSSFLLTPHTMAEVENVLRFFIFIFTFDSEEGKNEHNQRKYRREGKFFDEILKGE